MELKHKRSEQMEFSKAHDRFDAPLAPFLRVEECHFGSIGEWILDRVRNGDEMTAGIWVTPDIDFVRIQMAE